MNSQESGSVNERPTAIRATQSWGELLEVLRSGDGLQSSGEFFEPEELVELIEAVRDRRLPTQCLTRTDGLREKAEELLSRESASEAD